MAPPLPFTPAPAPPHAPPAARLTTEGQVLEQGDVQGDVQGEMLGEEEAVLPPSQVLMALTWPEDDAAQTEDERALASGCDGTPRQQSVLRPHAKHRKPRPASHDQLTKRRREEHVGLLIKGSSAHGALHGHGHGAPRLQPLADGVAHAGELQRARGSDRMHRGGRRGHAAPASPRAESETQRRSTLDDLSVVQLERLAAMVQEKLGGKGASPPSLSTALLEDLEVSDSD